MQPAAVLDLEPLWRALGDGDILSVATAAQKIDLLWKEILKLVMVQVSSECSSLCQKAPSASLLRSMSVAEMEQLEWATITSEIRRMAPTLHELLITVASSNDHRNKIKCGSAHNPGICMAVSILLKERCMHINGLQSIISLLLYTSNTNKVVSIIQNVKSLLH